MNQEQIENITEKINKGAIGVLPTDTVYGIVASVRHQDAIEQIYRETSRPARKPFIILIGSRVQLKELSIELSAEQETVLNGLWPGPVSVILPVQAPNLDYLHRGMNSLAVRLPDLEWLRTLIEKTGPIVATSANISGQPTPGQISQIKKQLPGLNFYVEGIVQPEPSKLVKIGLDGTLEWLERAG